MADDARLVARLEAKDNMTSTIIKSKDALKDLQNQAQTTSKTTENIVKSFAKAGQGLKELSQDANRTKVALSSIKNTSISISIKDTVSSPLNSIKGKLKDISSKSYAIGIHAKDNATDTILKVKSELSGIVGKTYNAILNVKTNTQPTKAIGNKMNEFAEGMLMPTSVQMAGAAGIGYGVYDTIKTSMDFDAQLSAIKALTPKEGIDGISRDEIMEQVRQRAKELGQATAFGNKEVAQGMTELIKAGITLKDVLGDASEAALNLATAGDLALPEAAEIMSTAMNTFGVKDATHAANILAGAANASATSVHEMKYSLSAVGIVAKKAGMDFDEVNTALALMASRGLKGSDAGTSLKSMLQQIEPASKPAVAAFEKLGLLKDGKNQFYDEKGQLRSLGEIADILHESTQGLTEQELNSLYKDAFGSDGIRAAQVLGEFTSESVKDMYNEITKVTAKEQSETMLDSLKGDIEQLSGAWENFQDTLMEGSATGGLRSLVKEITELVLDANKLFENGFTFWETFDLVTKPFRDAFSKMIQMDGMGSVVAGAGLFIGLIAGARKFYNIVVKSVQSVKSLIDIAKGIPQNVPGTLLNNLPSSLPEQSAKDIILNAQNVYVNGKNQPSESSPVTPNEPSTSPTNKPKSSPTKPSIWNRATDALKTGWNYGGGINKANIALTLPFAAYDIYSADEGEKGAAIARAGGGIAGGWAGAKIGGATGAAIGSILPGIGTGAGAIIGGAIGGIGGGILGSQFADSISRLFDFSAKDNIINRINNSSWGQAQIALPQMQHDSTMTNFSDIGDNVQNISDMQFQSNQIQIERQKQAFSELKDFVSNIWNEITDTTNTAGQMQLENSQIQTEGQMQLLSGLRDFATEIWNSIQQAGINAWENIQIKWNEAVGWFSSSICSPLESLAQSAGIGIAAGINSAIATIQGAWQGLVNWFEVSVFGPIKQKYLELKSMAPSPVQTVLNFVDGGLNIGHNATGTMNWKGGLTEINENGGEIVDLPTGSRIYPAQTSERIIKNEFASNSSSINGGNITITGNTFVVRNEQDIDEIAYRLMSLMR